MSANNRKIIALSGTGNVGKTTTIKKIYSLINAEYQDGEGYLCEENDQCYVKDDIRVMFTIHGVKIGIASAGDTKKQVRQNIGLFVKNNRALIICATKMWGQTVEVVEEHSGEYKISWYCNRWMADENARDEENEAKAQEIFANAKRFIESNRIT